MGGKHKNTYRNKDFTDAEIEILSKNPNIKSVSAKQINYIDSFKMHFLDEYAAGKLPLQIFIEAGFDPQMIGQGRIDKAGCRWRRKASRPGGVFDQKKGHSGRKNTLNGQISTEEQIEYLKQQNEYFPAGNRTLGKVGDAKEKISSSRKYKIITQMLQKHRNRLSASRMCEIAAVSRSGYYAWLEQEENRMKKEIQDKQDFELILKAYSYKNRYKGARGIKMVMLREYGIVMNLKKIRRLMKKFHLRCPIRKPNPYKKIGKALKSHTVKNLLERNFNQGISFRIAISF